MPERIGFYICHCGINIAYRVRVKEVAAFAASLPNVVISRDYLFMCSDPGQEMIENGLGYSYEGLERTVDSHIKNLRRKLGDDGGKRLQTIRGVGYIVRNTLL